MYKLYFLVFLSVVCKASNLESGKVSSFALVQITNDCQYISIHELKENSRSANIRYAVQESVSNICNKGLYSEYLAFTAEYLSIPISQMVDHDKHDPHAIGEIRPKPKAELRHKKILQPIAQIYVALEMSRDNEPYHR
jgi:methionine aminopeptidase